MALSKIDFKALAAHSLEHASSKTPKTHSRSQFRIGWGNLDGLYADFRDARVA